MAFDLDLLITFIPIIIGSGLSIIVYTKDRNNLNNQVFGGLCLALVLWSEANYFSLRPLWLSTLSWIRLVMFFAVFLQFMFLLFVYLFPQRRILMSKLKFSLLLLLTLATMLAAISPHLYPRLEIKNGEVVPIPGPLMPLFVLTIFLFWGLSTYYVIKKYYLSKDVERLQWRFILPGFLLMFVLLITSQFLFVVIFKETGLIKFGPIFTLPFIILSAYAIIRHQLLNVKVVATELLTGLILFILLTKIFFSTGIYEVLLNLGIFVAFAIFGILLIKGVLKEIEDKIKIQNLNTQLEKLDKTKSEFLSIASHQLRTPLTIVKGYISMMLENSYGKLSQKLQKPLENIQVSNERLIKLINTLLDISRIEAGKTELELRKNSLEEIISNVINEFKTEAQRKGFYLKWERPKAPLPEILIDKEKIRNAIFNLIDNAIKYTDHGGVTIEARVGGDKYQIKISDTGKGIDKEEIAKLFESFARGAAGTSVSTGGTGLGLYVAKSFVEMHNGRIWAESPGKGQGSTFYIELPKWKES